MSTKDDEKRDIVEHSDLTNLFGISDLERAFKSMMKYPWEWTRRFEEGFRTPLSEIHVDEKIGDITVTLEMPGVDKEDIEITLTKSVLTIVAESENRKYKRSFSFSSEFDPTETRASFNNGVLEITLKAIKKKEDRGYRVEID
ncbi:MAG: Hsp20/alpha crystallin family protein [Promethearchaeota archaeon]